MTTDAGKKQIIEDMRTIQQVARFKYDALNRVLDESKKEGEPIPYDLERIVDNMVAPEVDEAYRRVSERNGRIRVKPGTPITEEVIDQYIDRLRDFRGTITNEALQDARDMAREDGYVF